MLSFPFVTTRQGPIVELLTQWKAQLSYENASGELCDAASRYIICFPVSSILDNKYQLVFVRGDVDQIQRLINSKADLNKGDYDLRTAMHLVG